MLSCTPEGQISALSTERVVSQTSNGAGLGRLDFTGANGNAPRVQSDIIPPNGDVAWHFMLPGGACHAEDCNTDRERAQLIQSRPDNITGRSYIYTFSFFLPQDFADVSPTNTMLWEVKPFGPAKPSIAIEIVDSRLQFVMSNPGVSQQDKMNPERPSIIRSMGSIPRGRWTEVEVEVLWSADTDGQLTVTQNGNVIVNHAGPNVEAGVQRQAVMFGLYRSFLSRYIERTGQNTLPTQEAYFGLVAREQ